MGIKIAFFDMDSTVIAQEGIDELAKLCGKGKEVSTITQGAMHQGWNFEESLKKRMEILVSASLSEAQLETCYQSLTLTQGAKELVDHLKENGVRVVLVSGGFSQFTSRIAHLLDLDEEYGNELLIENGKITGVEGSRKFGNRIVGKEAKAAIVEHETAKHGFTLQQALFVGDGGNDVEAAKKAGLSIAFGSQNKALREAATYCIDSGNLADAIPLVTPKLCGKKDIIR